MVATHITIIGFSEACDDIPHVRSLLNTISLIVTSATQAFLPFSGASGVKLDYSEVRATMTSGKVTIISATACYNVATICGLSDAIGIVVAATAYASLPLLYTLRIEFDHPVIITSLVEANITII